MARTPKIYGGIISTFFFRHSGTISTFFTLWNKIYSPSGIISMLHSGIISMVFDHSGIISMVHIDINPLCMYMYTCFIRYRSASKILPLHSSNFLCIHPTLKTMDSV